MIPFIIILIVLTVGLATLVLAPALAERRVVFDDAPDHPCGFGPDMSWIALKTSDTVAVVGALGIGNPVSANWDCGIGTVYDDDLGENRVFVSPPVEGWVFVVGTCLPHPHGRFFVDKCTPLLLDLSSQFGDVQYFACYNELDLYAWAKLTAGRLVRGFGIGDDGVVWSRGRTTREERLLGLKLFELRGVRGRKGDAGGELLMHPTPEHVMRLAGDWSLNPTLLDGVVTGPGLGAIGEAPGAWRTERLRKIA
jgi:hypothetical protein